MSESTPPPDPVLDERWERVLAKGQEASGEHGDLDADLAALHLLRHARAPSTLSKDALDSVWREVASALPGATPWWRRSWIRWAALPTCAVAAALVFVVLPEQGGAPTVAVSESAAPAAVTTVRNDAPMDGAVAGRGAGPGTPSGAASAEANARPLHEVQFAALSAGARAELRASVAASRAGARHAWLRSMGATGEDDASSRGGGQGAVQ